MTELGHTNGIMTVLCTKVKEIVDLLLENVDAVRESYLPLLLDSLDAERLASVELRIRAEIGEWNAVVDPYMALRTENKILKQYMVYVNRRAWYPELACNIINSLSAEEWRKIKPLMPRLADVLPSDVQPGLDDAIPLLPEDLDESSSDESQEQADSD